MARINELSGKVFGRWTVIARGENDSRGKQPRWLCRCECGTEAVVIGDSLRSGRSKSCGCLHRELTSKRNVSLMFKHGLCDSSEYKSWVSMVHRCTNLNAQGYNDYGGRGITVCDRWLHSFENFLFDMGFKPTPKHTIERVDNDGNYEPSNCVWETMQIQILNRRLPKNNKSGYRGVSWNKPTRKWQAFIGADKSLRYLGVFDDVEDAARAYNDAALIYHMEHAQLNWVTPRIEECD